MTHSTSSSDSKYNLALDSISDLNDSLALITKFVEESPNYNNEKDLVKACEITLKKITGIQNVKIIFKGDHLDEEQGIIDIEPEAVCRQLNRVRFFEIKDKRRLDSKIKLIETCVVHLDICLQNMKLQRKQRRMNRTLSWLLLIAVPACFLGLWYKDVLHPDVLLMFVLFCLVLVGILSAPKAKRERSSD